MHERSREVDTAGPPGSAHQPGAKGALPEGGSPARSNVVGKHWSGYIVSTVQADAERIIREHQVITLSERDSRIFAEALVNPTGPNEALRAAFGEYREFIGQ